MKRFTKIFVFSLCLLLIMGCSSRKEDTASTKQKKNVEEKTPIKKKEKFDTSLMDAKLFDFISEDGVSEEDKEKIQIAYDRVYVLWDLILPNFLTKTHYDNLDNDKFIFDDAMLASKEDNLSQHVESGTYLLGNGTAMDAPFDYISAQDLNNKIQQLFAIDLNYDNTNAQSFYLPDFDGYVYVGGVGGARDFTLPNTIAVKKYKTMYVAIANYEGTSDYVPISGTFYLVFEKIEENGESRFVYRWFYTHVNE